MISGLNVLRIINEPTAAAIAYGLDKKKVQSPLLTLHTFCILMPLLRAPPSATC